MSDCVDKLKMGSIFILKLNLTLEVNVGDSVWTGNKLSRGQTRDWRTHTNTDRRTQAMTMSEGRNWPQVKTELPRISHWTFWARVWLHLKILCLCNHDFHRYLFNFQSNHIWVTNGLWIFNSHPNTPRRRYPSLEIVSAFIWAGLLLWIMVNEITTWL